MDWILSLPGAVNQGLVWGIMAIGVYISFKIMNISDMTVDGSICTGAAVCTVLILKGVNPVLAMIASFVTGMLTGIVTGLLHVALGIPAILSGILTQMALWSVNLKILGKANQAISARDYKVLISQMSTYPSMIFLFITNVVLIAVLYWFFGREIGCAIRATGNNEKMSRAQGVNTDAIKLMGFALSNGIVAFSGALLCQYQGFTDVNMGRGATVIGLAAVVIGNAVTKRISGNFAVRLAGVVAGSIIYYLVYQTVIFIGLDTDLLKMLSALVVAAFLGVPYISGNLKSKNVKER